MIIDAHVHIPTLDYAHKDFFKEPAKAIEYLRAAGTDAAIFNTWRGVYAAMAEDLNAANAKALELTREYAGFLYPGAVISPFHPEASIEWLKRFRDEGWLWVGELLPWSNPKCAYTDAAYMRLFEECARHGHILHLHNKPEIREVARRFPEMQVVCAHIPADEALLRSLAEPPNVWMDISGGTGGLTIGGMESARDAFGPDRLLYGTDFSGYEPRCFQARLEMAFPSPADQEKLYHLNVKRLLAKVGAKAIS